MQKEIVVGERKFLVRELLAVELDDTMDIQDKKLALKKQVTLSAGLNDEEYAKLTVKERIAIINAMNELNGVGNFQKG